MTHNSKLVEYFTNEFNSKNSIDLSHLTSTNFQYTINSGTTKNFTDFTKRRILYRQNACLAIGIFRSRDDVRFYADFKTQLRNSNIIAGVCMFEVLNGLIARVEIRYNLNDEDLQALEGILLNKN